MRGRIKRLSSHGLLKLSIHPCIKNKISKFDLLCFHLFLSVHTHANADNMHSQTHIRVHISVHSNTIYGFETLLHAHLLH